VKGNYNKQKNSMNILVTGCAGFIGWKVSELLLREGHAVVGIDNLNDAYDVRLKKWRLNQLRENQRFTFYLLDIVNRAKLFRMFKNFSTKKPFDAVINLAARAGVRQSVENPWTYYETNVIGTLNLLELCREFGLKKFILASTSSLYGTTALPFRENQHTDTPLSPYAASKKAAEALCYTYHYLYGLDISVLRYFTVYGPAGRPDMSIFRFIKWIAEGETVIIYGDGFQERDFTYIDDIARGTLAALKPLGYEIINLGNNHPVKLSDVIFIIEDLLGKRANIKYEARHLADMPATWADITKAQRLLGWQPQVSLKEGLQRAVEWYIENRQWVRKIEI